MYDLAATTSTTSDLKFFQGILPVGDLREFWVQKP